MRVPRPEGGASCRQGPCGRYEWTLDSALSRYSRRVMTSVTRSTVDRSCACCERTLLMGERATRFSPNGGGDYVDVCPLCAEAAVEDGWGGGGAPTSPSVSTGRAGGGGRRAALAARPDRAAAAWGRPSPESARDPPEDGRGAHRERADPAAPVRAG